MNKKKIYLVGFSFAAFIMLTALAVLKLGLPEGLSPQQLKAMIDSLGDMAPLAFIFICLLRGVIFIPCGLISALGGMVFGTLWGTLFTLIGLTGGAVITFYMARGLGKRWVERALGAKYDKYESYISKGSFCKIFLMRVIPILPFDVVSCLAGMSRVRVDKYVLATLIGSVPGILIYVFFGDSLGSFSLKRLAFSSAFILVFALMPLCYKVFMKLMRKIA